MDTNMARNYPNLRPRALKFLGDQIDSLGPKFHPVDAYLSIAMRLFGKNADLAKGAADFSGEVIHKLAGSLYGMLADQVPAVSSSIAHSQYDSSFAGRICSYMEKMGYRIDKNPGEINIVYLEGADANGTPNDDQPDRFNDRRLVITFQNGNPKIIGNWEATTEPGIYYTENPMNPAGAARIKFGQYLDAWEVGLHGNARPHRALIQVGPVTVFRDANKDYIRTGDRQDTGLFGINQHGGYDYPFSNINDAGAGCQVGRTMAGQEEFMDIVESDPRYQRDRSYRFATTIIAGDDLAKKS